MTAVMWTGTFVGVLFGLLHATYVYRLIVAEAPADAASSHPRAVYYGLWTFCLWVLFGTYVLVLGLIGAVLYIVFKVGR